MHISDFQYERSSSGMSCPAEWMDYCIDELRDPRNFVTGPRHLWFLIDAIEDLPEPVDLRVEFTPVFPYKYHEWKQNSFAFLEPATDAASPGFSYADAVNSASSFRAGVESDRHKNLKQYVAEHPEVVSLPDSLHGTQEVELPSGDKLDVLFKDGDTWIGVEVKSALSPDADVARGIFQCVKYEAVIRALQKTRLMPVDVRAVLVLESALPISLESLVGLLEVEVVDGVNPQS